MFRSKEKTQDSHSKLRRLLSEQLESRQLMASDMIQWTTIPAQLNAFPPSASFASGSSSNAVVAPGADPVNAGTPVVMGEFNPADVKPVPKELIKDVNQKSSPSSAASSDSATVVATFKLEDAPKDGSFGQSVVVPGADPLNAGTPVVMGEFNPVDVKPVPKELIKDVNQKPSQFSAAGSDSATVVATFKLEDAPKDGSFGQSVVVPGADPLNAGTPVVMGEFNPVDVKPVPKELIKDVNQKSSPSSNASFDSATVVATYKLEDAPKDGSFGQSVVVPGADPLNAGTPVVMGEYNPVDVKPVPKELIKDVNQKSSPSSATSSDSATVVATFKLEDAPKDGSFGQSVVVPGADPLNAGTPVVTGEYNPVDVKPVPQELIKDVNQKPSQFSAAGSDSATIVATFKLEDAPKDGSFGQSVVVLGADPLSAGTPVETKELANKVEKKSDGAATPWSGESVQRKKSSGSMRNQLVDSAFTELWQS